MDVRVEDYLNDKLQTLADFESLDSLVASVTSKQQLLKQQLADAEADLAAAHTASLSHAAAIRDEAVRFQSSQADIDRRLLIVTQSDTSQDAVRKFDSSMDKLRQVDIANAYFETLQNVNALSSKATANVRNAPRLAIDAYAQLHNLGHSLLPLQDAADGAAPHLLDYIGKQIDSTQQTIKDAYTTDFEAVLVKVLWPKAQTSLPESVRPDFEDIFSKLLLLQQPDLELQSPSEAPLVLFPLDVMTKPISQRFHYHFSGDRPTNRVEKPEYFFSHFVELLNIHIEFINDSIQPILLRAFGGSNLTTNPVYLDASSAWITALLPMVRSKLQSLIPRVSSEPRLLSHLVHELINFDSLLRNEWRYEPGPILSGRPWQGLAHEVLTRNNVYERWLQVEVDFALARYVAIISDSGTSELDYDSVPSNVSKPTKAAIRVHDLLSAITDRYRPLTSFGQKLRFLIDIQISIFDKFHERLHSGLEAFMTLTSSIGRTVQGASASDLAAVEGVSGLERLCRIYSSAEYLEKAMRDWSDDVFFLDLWNELQVRAQAGGAVAGNMTVQEVAQRTSTTLDPADESDPRDPATSGALFDETAAAYGRLHARSETVIIETFTTTVREALRAYSKSATTWTSTAGPESDDNLSVTPDVAQPQRVLTSSLEFLQRALAPLSLRRILRAVGRGVDTYVWDRVLLANKFTAGGVKQLRLDLAALDQAANWGATGLARSHAALVLLSLPGDNAVTNQDNQAPLVLADAERRLFADNHSARQVLELLGLDGVLTEFEARRLVRCRVEVGA